MSPWEVVPTEKNKQDSLFDTDEEMVKYELNKNSDK